MSVPEELVQAAAFAALPECEVAIVEAANKIDGEGALGVERTITALAREFGEPRPLNPYRDGEGRSLDERPTPLTPRERWGTCCPNDPECEHSYMDSDELTRYIDTPLSGESLER